MSSKAAEIANICPVCLETRPLKIAGRCKHSFCTECLITAIERAAGEVFSCPTCQADCPQPWDGVEGLVDFTGDEVIAEDLGSLLAEGEGLICDKNKTVPQDGRINKGNKTGEEYVEPVLDVKCRVCHYNKKEVLAINLCAECNNLHICQDCTEDHRWNRATRGHVLIPFWSMRKEEEDICKTHDSPINRYCHECKKAMCVVCVLLEHGDHTVEKLGDLVETKANTVKVILKEREEKMAKLQDLEAELTLLTDVAPMVDKQDVLIKEIEDHVQSCIDKMIKWKEELNGKVKADYQIIHDIPECLKKVTEMVQMMQGPIQQAGGLLAKTKHQPVYLDRLIALQQDFEALAKTDVDLEGREYINQLRELHDSNYCFVPLALDSLGKIDKTKAEKDEFKPEEIFTFTMPEDSNKKFIPCVANLGQSFAVAHPIGEGEPSTAIDIYEFPGKLKQTFKDHVPPLYDMSATPGGKLAILSDGTGRIGRSVKLFDSETGYISSTRNFDIAKPLSLGVTLRHQYVILGDNEQGERQITVVDKDGRVEHTHVIEEEIGEKQIKPSRITCGGRFIFVTGKLGCFAYEIKDTRIQGIGVCFCFYAPDNIQCVDISANVWDDLFFAIIHKNNFTLAIRVKDKESKSIWKNVTEHKQVRNVRGADRETRVSARGSHIVVSHGQTIRIYKV